MLLGRIIDQGSAVLLFLRLYEQILTVQTLVLVCRIKIQWRLLIPFH